jgi:hypothetical protein
VKNIHKIVPICVVLCTAKRFLFEVSLVGEWVVSWCQKQAKPYHNPSSHEEDSSLKPHLEMMIIYEE